MKASGKGKDKYKKGKGKGTHTLSKAALVLASVKVDDKAHCHRFNDPSKGCTGVGCSFGNGCPVNSPSGEPCEKQSGIQAQSGYGGVPSEPKRPPAQSRGNTLKVGQVAHASHLHRSL